MASTGAARSDAGKSGKPRPHTPALRSAAEAYGGVPALWSAGVGLGMLAYYLAFATPASGVKDSPEFTLVLATLGLAHPTGYPLYTLLGHAFVTALHRLGAGWAYSANAWSGVGGALAMAFYHALAARMLPVEAGGSRRTRFLAALLPVALLGLNPMWTVECTLAEINSWHLAWVCGICLFFVVLARQPRPARGWSSRTLLGYAASWGLVCGLGGSHHVTAIFFAASLSLGLVLILRSGGSFRPWMIPAVLLAGLVALGSYGYVFYRAFHPAQVQWPWLAPSAEGAIDHILARTYRTYLGGFHPSHFQAGFLTYYIYPLLLPGLLLFFALCTQPATPRERVIRWGLLAAAVLQTLYNFNYGVSDPVDYFLPCLAVALLAVSYYAAGLGARRSARRKARTWALVGTLGLLVLVGAWIRVEILTRRAVIGYQGILRDMWERIPDTRAIVLWPDDMYDLLKEYQIFNHEKTGLDVYNPNIFGVAQGRNGFIRKYGIDPLRGVEPLDANAPVKQEYYIGDPDLARGHAVAAITQNIVHQSKIPVFAFMPQVPTIRAFRAGALPAPAPPPSTPPLHR